MSKNFMPELPEKDRERVLRDTAVSIEETKYQRPLTEDELQDRREAYSDKSIAFADLEEKLNEAKADFKFNSEPIKMEKKVLLQTIRTKQESVNGTLFHLPDYENKVMETFNDKGEFISSRRLKPDERHTGNVFAMNKAS